MGVIGRTRHGAITVNAAGLLIGLQAVPSRHCWRRSLPNASSVAVVAGAVPG